MFNSSFNVYKTEWLDLVFTNRNKNYGAYVLRSESSSILTRALLIASTGFILAFVSPLVYNKFSKDEVIVDAKRDIPVDLSNAVHQMKKEEPKKLEPAKADPVKVKTVANQVALVVPDNKVITPPPTVDDTKKAVVSSVSQDGASSPNAALPSTTEKGDGVGSDAGTGGGDVGIYENFGVDENPEFTGGMKGWARYLQRNLNYPNRAQEDGVQGRVIISFVVEKDGSVTDISLVKGIGSGCDEEAMRVIKKSPLWKPGRNKGTAVRVRYNMPISFSIAN